MWRSTAAQTANNDAAGLLGRAIQAGQFDVSKTAGRAKAFEFFDEVRDRVMENLETFLAADDEQYEAGGDRGPDKSRGGSKSKGRSSRKSKTGGKAPKTVEEALDVKVTFGAFEGETLGDILEVDTEKADADFGYGDGERDGRDYIGWLAGSATTKSIRVAAELVAEENDIEIFEQR